MNKIKFLTALFAAVVLFATTPIQAHAFSGFQVGIVQGLISGSDNNPVDGASVSVTCNGNTQTATSNAAGFYSVQFANNVCTTGMNASVTATKNSQSGSASGVMQDGGTIGFLRLDLAVVHVPIVPEFGLITGLVALATSAGSYAFLKKRS